MHCSYALFQLYSIITLYTSLVTSLAIVFTECLTLPFLPISNIVHSMACLKECCAVNVTDSLKLQVVWHFCNYFISCITVALCNIGLLVANRFNGIKSFAKQVNLPNFHCYKLSADRGLFVNCNSNVTQE